MLAGIPIRVLRIHPDHSRSRWLACTLRNEGLRHELIPAWAKGLYCDVGEEGLGYVPHQKYQRQPTNHHAECYAMAVIEHRVEPTRWEGVDGSPAGPPDWLAGKHETVYECVRLLEEFKHAPKPASIHWYGEYVLSAACEAVGGRSVCAWLRAESGRVQHEGISLGDLDIVVMPASGGSLKIIEAKGEGDRVGGREDELKQVNSLALLHALGVDVEVWYVLSEKKPERTLPEVAPALRRMQFDKQQPRVRAGLDFSALRQVAACSIPRHRRSKGCECKSPCLARP